jgi:hypothetical protein
MLFVILVSNVTQCASQSEITRIEYHAASRTFRKQIIITPDSVTRKEEDFRKGGSPVSEHRKTSSKEWKRLLDALNGIEPESITQLKSPTDKRTYDAATHGSITITADSSSYTHGFDDTEPNLRLKPLMEEILRLD